MIYSGSDMVGVTGVLSWERYIVGVTGGCPMVGVIYRGSDRWVSYRGSDIWWELCSDSHFLLS